MANNACRRYRGPALCQHCGYASRDEGPPGSAAVLSAGAKEICDRARPRRALKADPSHEDYCCLNLTVPVWLARNRNMVEADCIFY